MAAYTARTYNQLCAARGTDLTKMADEFALIQAAIKDNLCVALADGAAAGDIAVVGMTATSRIVFVGHLSTKAAIATLADLTSECTAGADKITTSTTDTTSDQLLIIYIKA
jgi:hypothetical protein